MILSKAFKDLAFSILDKSKFRGFHLLRDLRFYASQFNLPVDTIFDVGANIGQTSIELRKYFPNSSIHAFEPINSTFEILKGNLAHDRKITLNNVALGSEEKEILVLLGDESCTNSLLSEVNKNDRNSVTHEQSKIQNIKVIKGDEYCKSNDVNLGFLLKTDTEGYDLDVLKGFEKTISDRKIIFILVEVTFDEANPLQTNFYKVNKYLTANGYRLAGFYDLMHCGGFTPNLNFCNCLWTLLPNENNPII
jgi:FkbM family methyltransferase